MDYNNGNYDREEEQRIQEQFAAELFRYAAQLEAMKERNNG